MSETQDRPLGERLKRGFETTILIPAASAIVGAAAKYLIKKLPLILEEKLLPKLLEKDAPQTVVKALEQTASTLGDGSGSGSESISEQAPAAGAQESMSNDEREEERRKREQRRRQRKSASAKAA